MKRNNQIATINQIFKILKKNKYLIIFYSNPYSFEIILLKFFAFIKSLIYKKNKDNLYFDPIHFYKLKKLIKNNCKSDYIKILSLRLFTKYTTKLIFKIPILNIIAFNFLTTLDKTNLNWISSYITVVCKK